MVRYLGAWIRTSGLGSMEEKVQGLLFGQAYLYPSLHLGPISLLPGLPPSPRHPIASPIKHSFTFFRSFCESKMTTNGVREEPFPAPSRHAKGQVNGIPTEVSCTNFADKILVTISQDGRLAQWVSTQIRTDCQRET